MKEPGKEFDQLRNLYSQKHRKYHNAQHINDCLAELDSSILTESANPLVEYALWFHDAVYDTHAFDNEKQSANMAAATLRKAGADIKTVEFVYSLIMATRHDSTPSEPHHQLLVDIDLAILGSSSERFAAFEKAIRSEYRWVPNDIYRQKRRAILTSFYEKPAIYSTEEFHNRYEQQARANLERLIAAL